LDRERRGRDDDASMNVRTALAWAAAAGIVLAAVAFYALNAGAGRYRIGWADDAPLTLAALAALAVGLLLALRRPANPIGWLLLTDAFVLILAGIAELYPGYARTQGGSHPGVRLAAAWNTWGWPSLFAPLVAIALVFPNGRLPSPRWRAYEERMAKVVRDVLVATSSDYAPQIKGRRQRP
jgi:hypothetical protein